MAVAPDLAASVAAAHFAEPKNVLARNVIANDLIKPGFADQPIADLLIDRDARIGAEHIYSDVLATEGKPSSQKASGRCWMFAALNVCNGTARTRMRYLPNAQNRSAVRGKQYRGSIHVLLLHPCIPYHMIDTNSGNSP